MAEGGLYDEEPTVSSASVVEIKVFGRWDPNEVQIEDISLAVSARPLYSWSAMKRVPKWHAVLQVSAVHFVFLPSSPCSLLVQDYIAIKEKNAVFLPHTAGRYAKKRFRKAQVSEHTIC